LAYVIKQKCVSILQSGFNEPIKVVPQIYTSVLLRG
jgi:hypothetical protein